MTNMFANTMRSVSAACLIGGALAGFSLPAAAQDAAEATTETAAPAQKQGLQAGSLVCKGDGGWGAIITSKKSFKCIFAAPNGQTVGTYDGVITKIGLDLGKTGQSVLTWLVLGPAAKVGENFEPGWLAGNYAGVGAEATVGIGGGVNALVGGGAQSFSLQPVSVQVQTGISVAAGVQQLTLTYTGPAA